MIDPEFESHAAEYSKMQAAEFSRMSAEATTDQLGSAFAGLARNWLILADQIERLEQIDNERIGVRLN